MDQRSLNYINDNPIGSGLDDFRAYFKEICEGRSTSTADALELLGQEDLRKLVLAFLFAVQNFPAARLLSARTGRGTLRNDLLRLELSLASDDFDLDRIKPLLRSALADECDDTLIWEQVRHAVTESTPPPQPVASSIQQTPLLRNTSSFANTAEHRKYVDAVLKEELGTLYIGLPGFYDAYFREVADLGAASEAFFAESQAGSNPRFNNGWTGWPQNARQEDVLRWFSDFSGHLAAFAERRKSVPIKRRPLATPNKPIDGSIGTRKLDVGFVDDPEASENSRCHWSQILIPGELKSNPSADKALDAWLDLGRYAREVLSAQDNRRFVLGFTICGPLMRIWAFDRLGGIASEQFDINQDGLRFIFIILGFLWMDKVQLGYDPTIMTAVNKERFINITRNGLTERIIIKGTIKRAPCIAGRATTCWKAYQEGKPDMPLVIKDSWQYMERDEEGEMLQEVTSKGVVNVARHYYHETVIVDGKDDEIRGNIRGGLDITKAANYRPESPTRLNQDPASVSRHGRHSSRKRSSSQIGASYPPSKRSRSTPPTKFAITLPNRVHRRVILKDYGRPIYKASSRAALLAAFEGCIEGHESLHKAGFLHRDISINNLMINEDKNNPSWPSFLIDLDLAIRVQREGASGAQGKTGTRAFMAIDALLGKQHSFMHDLESFFWVLFWICIHCSGPNKSRVVPLFEKWNYMDTEELAMSKKGLINDEADFLKTIEANFTTYYRPLVQCVNRLRRKVFPGGHRWKKQSEELYSLMKEILREAREDPKVLG